MYSTTVNRGSADKKKNRYITCGMRLSFFNKRYKFSKCCFFYISLINSDKNYREYTRLSDVENEQKISRALRLKIF